MPSQPTFHHFVALPEHIRKDIWQRAVRDVTSTPPVRFMALARGGPNWHHEWALISAEMNRVQNEEVVAQHANGDADYSYEQDKAIYSASREYRASLVTVAPEWPRLPAHLTFWRLSNIADICTDAEEFVLKQMRIKLKRLADEKGIAVGFDPAKDVVCLRGPEDCQPDWPFFAEMMIYDESGLRVPRQVVVVGRKSELTDLTLIQSGWSHAYPSLEEVCPDMARICRVAFIYTGNLKKGTKHGSNNNAPWLGLDVLWPQMMPDLKEIYLLDESIKLRRGLPHTHLASSNRNFAGGHGTFYEVGPDESDTWDIRTNEGELLPVFQCAAGLQDRYETQAVIYSVPCKVTVKVLAHISHSFYK